MEHWAKMVKTHAEQNRTVMGPTLFKKQIRDFINKERNNLLLANIKIW